MPAGRGQSGPDHAAFRGLDLDKCRTRNEASFHPTIHYPPPSLFFSVLSQYYHTPTTSYVSEAQSPVRQPCIRRLEPPERSAAMKTRTGTDIHPMTCYDAASILPATRYNLVYDKEGYIDLNP